MQTAQLNRTRQGNNGRNPYGIPYLSASRLKKFRTCPMEFYFCYILGLQFPTSLAMFKGSRLHDAVEYFLKNRWLGRELSENQITEYLIRSWSREAEKVSITFKSSAENDKALDSVSDGLKSYLDKYGDEKPAAVETELRAPLNGLDWPLDLLGYVDMIRDDGTLIEIKTTSRKPSGGEEKIIFSNSIQLAAYDLLYKKLQGKPLEAVELRTVVFKKVPEIIPVRVESVPKVAHRIFQQTVTDLLQALKNKHFPRNPQGMFCPCSFFGKCQETR